MNLYRGCIDEDFNMARILNYILDEENTDSFKCI